MRSDGNPKHNATKINGRRIEIGMERQSEAAPGIFYSRSILQGAAK
jgi:hypothetical protein